MFVHDLEIKDYPEATIRLVTPSLDYATLSLKWVEDSEVGQYMGADFSGVSIETENKRIEDQLSNDNLLSWMIEYNGQVIGNIEINGIKEATMLEGKKAGKFSTLIGDKAFWGKRIAPAAKRAVIDWAFTEGGFEVLIGRALEENRRSWRSLEYMGFTFRSFEADTVNGKPARWKWYAVDKALWTHSS